MVRKLKRMNIALEEPTHKKLTRFGKKGESYNDITLRLLRDEPFIQPLKLAFQNYQEANEAFRHSRRARARAARGKAESRLGDLMRQIQHFIDHVEERSK